MFCHCPALVVSSQKHYVLGIVELEAEQEDEDFDRVNASVNVVPQKEHLTVRSNVDNFFEHMNQIVELTVDVAHNDHRFLEVKHVGLGF